MRALLSASLVLLSACATAPTGEAPRLGPAPVAVPRDPVAALSRAGTADAMTFEAAQRLFGRGDVDRREGRGGLLSYRLPTCALALVFAMDAAGALRLAAVEAGPPTPRDPAPSLSQCAAEATARARTAPMS